MTSMIERVGKALCAPTAGDWENQSDAGKGWWRDLARIAIEEMVNPTENMIDHGVVASERQSVSTIYRAMITAALKENGE